MEVAAVTRFHGAQLALLLAAYGYAWQLGLTSYSPAQVIGAGEAAEEEAAFGGYESLVPTVLTATQEELNEIEGEILRAQLQPKDLKDLIEKLRAFKETKRRRELRIRSEVLLDEEARARALSPAVDSLDRMASELQQLQPTRAHSEAAMDAAREGRIPAENIARYADSLALEEWAASNAWRMDAAESVAWAGEQQGYAQAAQADEQLLEWVTEADGHVCVDCVGLGSLPPMPLAEWPTTPGSGDTECNVGCRCVFQVADHQGLSELSHAQQAIIDKVASQRQAVIDLAPIQRAEDVAAMERYRNLGRGDYTGGVHDLSAPGGGFTIDPVTGESRTQGYAVAVEGHSGIYDAKDFFSPGRKAEFKGEELLRDYIRQNRDVLSKPGVYLGAWHDPASGKIFLDPSEVVDHREAAVRLGKARDQISVYSLHDGVEIPTGGTGGLKEEAPKLASKLAAGERVTIGSGEAVAVVHAAAEFGKPINLEHLHVRDVQDHGKLFDYHASDLSREQMPQIGNPAAVDEFATELRAKGISSEYQEVSPLRLHATQNEIDPVKVDQILHSYVEKAPGPEGQLTLVVAKDGAVLDGHHRWAATSLYAIEHPDYKVRVLRVNTNIQNLLKEGQRFDAAHDIAHRAFGQAEAMPLPGDVQAAKKLGEEQTPGIEGEIKRSGEPTDMVTPEEMAKAEAAIKAAGHEGGEDAGLLSDVRANPQGGINSSWRAKLGNREVLVKADEGERLRDAIRAGHDAAHEEAAALVARKLGVVTPPVVQRDVMVGRERDPFQLLKKAEPGSESYSVQPYIDGGKAAYQSPVENWSGEDLHKIAMLDEVIGNSDRHMGNVLLFPDETGKARAFRTRTPEQDQLFRRRAAEDVRGHEREIETWQARNEADRAKLAQIAEPGHEFPEGMTRSLAERELKEQIARREGLIGEVRAEIAQIPTEPHTYRVMPIDHGLSFPEGTGWGREGNGFAQDKVAENYRWAKLSKADRKALEGLKAPEVQQQLGDLLTQKERLGMNDRIDALLKRGQIASREAVGGIGNAQLGHLKAERDALLKHIPSAEARMAANPSLREGPMPDMVQGMREQLSDVRMRIEGLEPSTRRGGRQDPALDEEIRQFERNIADAQQRRFELEGEGVEPGAGLKANLEGMEEELAELKKLRSG